MLNPYPSANRTMDDWEAMLNDDGEAAFDVEVEDDKANGAEDEFKGEEFVVEKKKFESKADPNVVHVSLKD